MYHPLGQITVVVLIALYVAVLWFTRPRPEKQTGSPPIPRVSVGTAKNISVRGNEIGGSWPFLSIDQTNTLEVLDNRFLGSDNDEREK